MIALDYELDGAATGAERDTCRLIRQAIADGQAGQPPRSEHPAYGAAYAAESRKRLVLARERILCIAPGVRCAGCGYTVAGLSLPACRCATADPLKRTAGMFTVYGADADGDEAVFTGARYLASLVRDGARIIGVDGHDLTQYATLLQ